MPDITPEQKISGLEHVIAQLQRLHDEPPHKRSGLPAYAKRRIPELEAAIVRHLRTIATR